MCGLNFQVKTAHLRRTPLPVLLFLLTLLPFPHQIFGEGCDLSGEHSQVEETCGDFVVVLGQMAIPQVLQHLNILLLVFHMG